MSSDCPVSNSYAPEIQRICKAYEPSGVACSLAYEDVTIDEGAVRRHMDAFAYRGIPATIDSSRTLAGRARATITPAAVVIDKSGQIGTADASTTSIHPSASPDNRSRCTT